MYHLGIDFGNSYISAGVYLNGQPEMIRFSDNSNIACNTYVLPVSAYMEPDMKIRLGYEAELLRLKQPYRYRNNFKNNLGSHAPYIIDGVEYSTGALCRSLLNKVRDHAIKQYGGDISNTVFTYSNATSLYKKSLFEKEARISGLPNISFISDADAAIHYECFKERHSIGDRFMVCDIGGTTFNLSLKIYTKNGYADIIPPIMINDCGGCSFSRKIFDDIVGKNGGKYESAVKNNNIEALNTFEQLSERVKIYLDVHDRYNIETVSGNLFIKYSVTRSEYETMISEYINTILKVITYALRRACLNADEITSLVFIGGSSKTPCIQNRICSLLQKPLPKNDFPELSACLGAAISFSQDMKAITEAALFDYREIEIGSVIQLGAYQDENILWRVVSRDADGYLLVSKNVICFKAYSTISAGEKSGPPLIKWLNSHESIVSYEYPPSADEVWYNAYEKEAGFLAGFDDMNLKVMKLSAGIGIPKVDELTAFEHFELASRPTRAALEQSEGSFGEEYDINSPCPYWISDGSEYNIIDKYGKKDTSVKHDGTVGVRPVIVLNKNIYASTGDGSVENPYKVIC